MATVATGVVTTTDKRIFGTDKFPTWESVTVFTLISGDTTGTATIPIYGLLQTIIVKVSNMAGAAVTPDVSLTDNGDNTIWAVTGLAESTSYKYSVSEPLVTEVNLVLAFEDPVGAGTITVTLRGV